VRNDAVEGFTEGDDAGGGEEVGEDRVGGGGVYLVMGREEGGHVGWPAGSGVAGRGEDGLVWVAWMENDGDFLGGHVWILDDGADWSF
jgi:hypothetical protein